MNDMEQWIGEGMTKRWQGINQIHKKGLLDGSFQVQMGENHSSRYKLYILASNATLVI